MTTAHFLKTTTYHILANPSILSALCSELKTAMPNASVIPPLQDLEQLPYLSAVIHEGFRISYGVTQRLPRVSPDAALRFQDWSIPAGTPVGMTSIFMHDNETIFPDPYTFNPDRWLFNSSSDSKSSPSASGNSAAAVQRRQDRYLVNFSKGTRSCLGINLAHAEIYLTLAAVFRRFGEEMRLWETQRERDVDVKHDFFNPQVSRGSKGVRVVFGK